MTDDTMRPDIRRRHRAAAAVMIVLALVGGTVTWASAHEGDATKIHGCVVPSSGYVRIVGATESCKKGENAVDWNSKGEKGDKGDTGDTGAQGPQGPAGPAGFSSLDDLAGTPCTVRRATGTVVVTYAAPGDPTPGAPQLVGVTLGCMARESELQRQADGSTVAYKLLTDFSPAISSAPGDVGWTPLARTGTPATADDACTPLAANSLDGTIALVRRGTCTFRLKAENALAAGAVGVILYNNTTGLFSPALGVDPVPQVPVVMVTQDLGLALNQALDAGAVSMTMFVAG